MWSLVNVTCTRSVHSVQRNKTLWIAHCKRQLTWTSRDHYKHINFSRHTNRNTFPKFSTRPDQWPLRLVPTAQDQLSAKLCRPRKKISYRRDDARRWSSSRSRSFKVTNFDTNRKPVCDLKVNSTKVRHISYRFPGIAQYLSNYRLLTKEWLSLTHSFSPSISLNICISDILPKLDSLGYIFCILVKIFYYYHYATSI